MHSSCVTPVELTAAQEAVTTTLGTRAGGRKATAAVIAGDRTAAVMTTGEIPTEC